MASGISGAYSKVTTRGGPWAQSSYARPAQLTTALAGNNNDLTYMAKAYSSGSNSIRIRYVVAGASTPLSVSVSGNDITVNVATSAGSAATSTANDVRTAVLASTPAMGLLGSVDNAPGNDGTGVVAALAFTNLAGGADNEWARGSGAWQRRSIGRGFSKIS